MWSARPSISSHAGHPIRLFGLNPIGVRQQGRATPYAALFSLALLLCGPVGAADLQVDPIRIELSPQQQIAVLTISNDSDQPTSIQIQAVAWSQSGGKDVYVPTRELLVAPPIVTIAPRSEQVIRAALRRQADAGAELAYRIYLQELPPPKAPGFSGMQVALRIGLPVFVQSQTGIAAPKMLWRIARGPGNSVKVTLQNQGNAHVQVTDFMLRIPGKDQALGAEAGSTYVLAGQTHEWLIDTDPSQPVSGGPLRLKAYTDAGDVEIDLPLDGR